jgi:uncharacterized damage-inducible protein DinB
MKARSVFAALALVSIVSISFQRPLSAQEVTSKDAATVIKTGFVADLEELEGKFVGLAEAIPQDKYTWRPMEGVRSVSEVLMLAASEGYSFIPSSFGAKPADLGTREESAKIRATTDKAQIIEHLKKSFAYAKQQVGALDGSTLTGRRKVMGIDMSVTQTADHIAGDLHEHLGQLIAYARMNHVVPPWSK